MNGIYIHIPFCLSKCSYCDFYSVTRSIDKGRFCEAIMAEINYRYNYLNSNEINTVYFGGGTPSLFSASQLDSILGRLSASFRMAPDTEITIEVNPDDISPGLLKAYRSIGINRISMGIQSFFEEHLRLMNRRHSAGQAVSSAGDARMAGFENISIDLIYGIPGMTAGQWKNNLDQAVALPVDHISAYHLTFEPGTRFAIMRNKGILKETGENESVSQYRMLIEILDKNRFEMYEISNFARNGLYSRHNMKYWMGESYLGLGPSAHSYNGMERHWNPASMMKYYHNVESGTMPDGEVISKQTRLNEHLMTRLRTKWGIAEMEFTSLFGWNSWSELIGKSNKYLISGDMRMDEGNRLVFTQSGWFISDGILAGLFF